MLTLRGLLIACLVATALAVGVQGPAAAGCPEGYQEKRDYECTTNNDGSQTCQWVTECVYVGGGSGGSDGEGSGGGGGGPVTCTYQGKTIPCTMNGATWAGSCYRGDPIPYKTKDVTGPNGEKVPQEGRWHWCYLPPGYHGPPGRIWVPTGETPPVDPVVLAYRAIAQMDLSPVEIGIAPTSLDDNPDSIGLVGLPTWMWVENPDRRTWGPITTSASQGPASVSATARADRVEWDMGDGTVVTCDQGTPYRDSFGKSESPSCGHRYEQSSADQPDQAYPITATTHWVIEWDGFGQSGSIELDVSSETRIRVGEVQTLGQ